ncbi:MAG: hypothetical protein ACYDAE_02815 [Steroidobacteraceae bacterium]
MDRKQRKWGVLAVTGSLSGLAALFLFRSIPIAAGSATAVILMIIIIKHLALAAMVGSPLFGLFQGIKPKLREHCPWRPAALMFKLIPWIPWCFDIGLRRDVKVDWVEVELPCDEENDGSDPHGPAGPSSQWLRQNPTQHRILAFSEQPPVGLDPIRFLIWPRAQRSFVRQLEYLNTGPASAS